jgi:hypothetical protein
VSQPPKALSPLKLAHFEQDELPGQTEGSALKKRKTIIIRLIHYGNTSCCGVFKGGIQN